MLDVPVIVLSGLSASNNMEYYFKLKSYSNYVSNMLILYKKMNDNRLKIEVINNTGLFLGRVDLTFNEKLLSFKEIVN